MEPSWLFKSCFFMGFPCPHPRLLYSCCLWTKAEEHGLEGSVGFLGLHSGPMLTHTPSVMSARSGLSFRLQHILVVCLITETGDNNSTMLREFLWRLNVIMYVNCFGQCLVQSKHSLVLTNYLTIRSRRGRKRSRRRGRRKLLLLILSLDFRWVPSTQ